jgi:hypothetical protein
LEAAWLAVTPVLSTVARSFFAGELIVGASFQREPTHGPARSLASTCYEALTKIAFEDARAPDPYQSSDLVVQSQADDRVSPEQTTSRVNRGSTARHESPRTLPESM